MVSCRKHVEDLVIQPGLSAKMVGIDGTYTIVQGDDGMTSDMDITASALTYDFDPMDTETGEKVDMGFAANDMTTDMIGKYYIR